MGPSVNAIAMRPSLLLWCATTHRGFKVYVNPVKVMLCVGGDPYRFPSPPGASIEVRRSELGIFWRYRIARALVTLRRAFQEN